MTIPQRLCVLQFPSPTETAWTTAIKARADELGWGVHDLAVENEWPRARERNSAVYFTTGIHGAEALDPTHWIVLTENATTSAEVVSGALGVSPFAHASLVHTSIRLALSAKFADEETAVHVMDARALRLEMPSLGHVERAPIDGLDKDVPDQGPLDIFDRLPIPVGASAEWAPEIFNYPKGQAMQGGSPDVDLTGRARVLLFGPFVYLPAGTWTVNIDLAIDPMGGKVPLRFEWGNETEFVSHAASVTTAGHYTITLVRDWEGVAPAQVRLWLTQPLFQGRLVFHGCRITRASDDMPETTSTEDA